MTILQKEEKKRFTPKNSKLFLIFIYFLDAQVIGDFGDIITANIISVNFYSILVASFGYQNLGHSR